MKTKRTIPLLPILSLVCFHITGQTTFYGPTSYLEPSDVPVGFYANGSASFIEDFEDMSLDGGISASSGAILQTGPSPDLMADGVDIDDGAIDGSGTNGSNHFTFSGSVGITYTFDQLKTEAGLVWTDGTSSTAQWTFEAFGAGMVSLGTYGPFQVGDTNNNGQTAEDRFFGVTNPNGIIAIKISQVSGPTGGLEVDHIQYGDNVTTGGGQTTFYGPSAYSQPSDVPVGFYASGSASFIEDFEDMSLDGGISASSGAVLQTGPSPNANADGVDIDDGVIDGSGNNGSNHFTASGATGITYTFNQLRPEAGLVWTDGSPGTQWTFEAFGAGMVSLGTHGPFPLGDTNNNGQTAEDRFFGVTDPNGIIAIKIYQVNGPMGGLEVDHIQYGGSQPLPVELVKFDAHLKNEQVYLNWNTASEINSMGFEIEKSKDGRAWKLIGFMNGNGTTNEAHEYEYRDSNPFLGINYYRLKQIDFDEAYEYSRVVAIKYHDPEKVIQVFPNPFSGSQLNFHLTSKVQSVYLFDLRGQLIRQQAVNQYVYGNYEWLLPNLPAGVYWLMVNAEGEYWAERVVKK